MTISDLDFSDEICLLEDDFNAAEEFFSSVIAAVAKMCSTIDAKKTQELFSNHAPEKLKCGKDVVLKMSNFFNKLGSTITHNEDITEKIRNRTAKPTINSKGIQLLEVKEHLQKTVAKLHQTYERSTLLYGSES